jgi:hypothetical protein
LNSFVVDLGRPCSLVAGNTHSNELHFSIQVMF